MSKLTMFASAGVLSVVVAGSVVAPAYAWEPQGVITKSVQNVSANDAVSAADTPATAVSAKPGDLLTYVIEVKNVAKPAQKQYNDMDFTVVTDTLPAGVELVSDPGKRVLKEEMGLILPGKSKKVEYKVKVTSTTNGTVVTNKACFTADSVVKDNAQKGCDDAAVKVTVPVVTPPAITPPVATPPVTEVAPVVTVTPEATLPAAGVGAFVPLAAVAATVAGYFSHLFSTRRRLA